MSIELLREIHKYAKGLTAAAATVTTPELESAFAEVDALQSRLAAAEAKLKAKEALDKRLKRLAQEIGENPSLAEAVDALAERLANTEAERNASEANMGVLLRRLGVTTPDEASHAIHALKQAEAGLNQAVVDAAFLRNERDAAAAEVQRIRADAVLDAVDWQRLIGQAEARADEAEKEIERLGAIVTECDGVECIKHDPLVRYAIEQQVAAENREAALRA